MIAKEGPPWSKRSWITQWTPFRGIYYDLRRRAPYYVSDWTVAFDRRNLYRVVASVVRMYFINLMPAVAYTLDMSRRTGQSYGINETILASALAAIAFPLFSCQPLTIVGVTGLISLVNYTQYDIVTRYNVNYLQFQAWALIWSAITHWLVAIFNISDYVRFITDMTSETFGLYVGTIYIVKGIELLIAEFEESNKQNGWLSCFVAVIFTTVVYLLQKAGHRVFGPFWARKLLSDYSFAIGIIFFTGFTNIPGNIKSVDLLKVPITKAFSPSTDRDWVVPFWNLDGKWIAASIPFGCLITLLFYFDHSVSSVMAQARHFPIKRPAGFHWDFFLLGCVTFVSGIIGLPAPNGLVPQAPVNTESLCVTKQMPEHSSGGNLRQTADVPSSSSPSSSEKQEKKDEETYDDRNSSRTKNSNDESDDVVYKPVVTRVVEQRVNHLAMGLLTLGTMTRPLLVVLGLMSRAMFAGVFILVGWASIEGNGILHKFLFLCRDPLLTPKSHPLLGLPKRKIALYAGIQLFVWAASVAISQTIAAIGFPIIVTLLIPWRSIYGPKVFTPHELSLLDAPTADSLAVLISVGGELERVTGEGLEYAPDTGLEGTLARERHQQKAKEIANHTRSIENDSLRRRKRDVEEVEIQTEQSELRSDNNIVDLEKA